MITSSLSLFLDMCLPPQVMQKVYTGKQVWGETYRDARTKFD
jgi:hypothetical protein